VADAAATAVKHLDCLEHPEHPEHVERLKVGGMALPDGVLMRTGRAWAVARADGTVTTGAVTPPRWEKVPLLRVLTGLAGAIRLGFGGATGGVRRRSPGWPMIRALLSAEAAAVSFTWLLSAARLSRGPLALGSLGGRWAAGISVWLVAMLVFRYTSPADQWRYHGAEHKAVAAYERSLPLDDVDAVLACPRIHPRCGTNLVVWLVAATPAISVLPWLLQPVAFLVVVAATAELLSLAARWPASLPWRIFLVPGAALQWSVTTREPSPSQQAVGCTALLACLVHHRELAPATAELAAKAGCGPSGRTEPQGR
jgi:uncharacterized protein YqhQ